MKKKQLPKIILENILKALSGMFLFLLAITGIIIYLYVKSRTDDLITLSLERISSYSSSYYERDRKEDITWWKDHIDSDIREKGVDYINTAEFAEWLKKSAYENTSTSEMSRVSPDGIILASSVSGNVGFDMHSTEQSEKMLKKIGESDGIYIEPDFNISPIHGLMIRYNAAYLSEYDGFILSEQTKEEYYLDKRMFLFSRIPFMRIGREGYFLLIDGDNDIIASPENVYNGEKPDLNVNLRELTESGRMTRDTVYGVSSYVRALKEGNDLIVGIYPVSETWESWKHSLIVLVTIYIIVFAILFLLIHRLTMKHVVKGVVSLDGSLKKITEGDLEEKADFRESVEFDEFSNGINHMVDRLKGLIKEAEETIDAELALSAKVQAAFLPREFPPFPERDEFELYAKMVPAKEVGGDFYDFFLIDEDHLALVMADVSGKGIPAAMFMVMAKDKLRHSTLKYGTDVAEAIREVNAELCAENDEMLFVTVWLGVFTISTGRMDYVDAGHNYPAICRNGEKFTVEEDVHEMSIALLDDKEFEAGAFTLSPGDILFLYTDGVTEACDPEGKLFHENRMLDALNEDTTLSVEDIDASVRTAVAEFAQGEIQSDDITTLVFRYKKVKEGTK